MATKGVIPAKAGIQKNTGFRVKPGMTNSIRLMSSCIDLFFLHALSRIHPLSKFKPLKNPPRFHLILSQFFPSIKHLKRGGNQAFILHLKIYDAIFCCLKRRAALLERWYYRRRDFYDSGQRMNQGHLIIFSDGAGSCVAMATFCKTVKIKT